MRHFFSLQGLLLALLMMVSILGTSTAATQSLEAGPAKPMEKSSKIATSKAGYSVDGRTSASVLTAQRSHQVAKDDEIGLAVFSGLIVIAVIGFFSQKLFEK